MKSLINLALRSGLRCVPSRFAKHLMFTLASQPELADAWGYHVRKVHYYDPLPDFKQIDPELLATPSRSLAVDLRLESQRSLIQELAAVTGELHSLASSTGGSRFPFGNEYFAGLDAACYYAIIRRLKPKRIVEIGCGFSSRIASEALERNREEDAIGSLICIEPYPQPRLLEANLNIELLQKRIEEIPLEFFDSLDRNDILFIDSSHAVKCQGDVVREFLEVIPRIKSGVWIHVHDIFFPYDYPKEWVIDRRIAFTEQYLLQAFLAFNSQFQVELCNYWISQNFATEEIPHFSESFHTNSYHGKSSFWMSRL